MEKSFTKIRHYLGVITIIFCLSSCFAPRCPDKSCHVGMEHRHNGQAFRGRGTLFKGKAKVHTPWWYLTRNSEGKQGGGRKNTDPKTKKRFKKLLPWEKV
jgi:hypothetical protein